MIPLSPCNCQLTWICSLCTPFLFFSLFCVSCGRSMVYSPPKAVKIESSRILHRLKFLKIIFHFICLQSCNFLCHQCRKTWLIKELNNSSAVFYLKRNILSKIIRVLRVLSKQLSEVDAESSPWFFGHCVFRSRAGNTYRLLALCTKYIYIYNIYNISPLPSGKW